jgi:thioredoxin-dependent peroxiredoxin
LSDVDREVGRRYETVRAPEEPAPEWAKRRTYLIDPEGVIRRAYRVRDIPNHPTEVLEDLRARREEGRSPA